MIDIPGNWELAKAMPSHDPMEQRRRHQLDIAEARAADLRAQGYNVTIIIGANGSPQVVVS